MLIEIILEPDTKFTVIMIGPDEQKPGTTRIVLDVKETTPTLKSELMKFKNICEYSDKEISKEFEENLEDSLKTRGSLDLESFDQEQSSISCALDDENKSKVHFNCEERGEVN